MEYDSDCADKPYYPDVVQLARQLVRQSINGLDSLALQQRLLRNKIRESHDLAFAEGGYASFPPQLRVECPFGMNKEFRLNFAIAFCPLNQSRPTPPK